MASISLGFSQPLNNSLQQGDKIYYSSSSTVGGFQMAGEQLVLIGTVESITTGVDIQSGTIMTFINATMDDLTDPPGSDNFIFFSKDNVANLTSILGYYNEVEFKNDSRTKAELFAAACGIVESSK